MTQYRFGVVFNLEQSLRHNDPTGMFNDSIKDRQRFLHEVIRFLTEDVCSAKEARAMVNEYEHLIGVLYHQEIIDAHLLELDEPYAKICGVMFAILESIVDILEAVRFYEYCESYMISQPFVHRLSNSNFAILVKHRLRKQ